MTVCLLIPKTRKIFFNQIEKIEIILEKLFPSKKKVGFVLELEIVKQLNIHQCQDEKGAKSLIVEIASKSGIKSVSVSVRNNDPLELGAHLHRQYCIFGIRESVWKLIPRNY